MRKLLLAAAVGLGLLWTGTPCLSAVEPPNDAVTAPIAAPNSAPITDPAQVRYHYRQMLSRPEYQEVTGADTNVRMREWLSRWFTRLSEDINHFQYAQEMPRLALLLMALFVVLSLSGLLYTLMKLARNRSQWNQRETSEGAGEKLFRPPEFYEEELRKAVAAGNWHEAWLASWRQFLSRLEHGRMVEADRSRTNREYLSQLRAHPLPAAAEALLPGLVDAYDNFIYGRKPIGEAEWNSFHQQVDEAALLLHLRESAPLDPLTP